MKSEEVDKNIFAKVAKDYWQVVLAAITIIAMFVHMGMDISSQKVYVDYKIENLNQKVDYSINQNNQLDEAMDRINDRLDEILEDLSGNKK